MLQMFTARTNEIDEFDLAWNAIKRQIDFDALQKNSVGLLFCTSDFLDGEVLGALCAALPFDTVGITSMATACTQGYGFYDLCLTVLTSDEVAFTAGVSAPLTAENYQQETKITYDALRGKVADNPVMAITFLPYLMHTGGHQLIRALTDATDHLPLWGAIASSTEFTMATVKTLFNGNVVADCMTLLLINGAITPRFVVTALPEKNISTIRGLVTASNGAVISRINDLPVSEYLAYLNIDINNATIRSTPFLFYFEGYNRAVVLAVYEVLPDGSLLMGGDIPVGTGVSIGGVDRNTIMQSANDGLDEVLAMDNRNAILLLPCVTRGTMMIPEREEEIAHIYHTLKPSGTPFAMGYSGGEISPVYAIDGLRNHFHNYTFCACVL